MTGFRRKRRTDGTGYNVPVGSGSSQVQEAIDRITDQAVSFPVNETEYSELEKSVEDYNRRAKAQGYRTLTVEEALNLIRSERAVICEFCHAFVSSGNHKKYFYSYGRHLQFSSNCLRIRLVSDGENSAVTSSPATENDQNLS